MKRLLKHLTTGGGTVRRKLSKKEQQEIEQEVKQSELSHHAELKVIIEASLPPLSILKGLTPRYRAIELFSDYRIWDTEENSGVLIYLLFADRDIEIVSDRGINKRVSASCWQEICKAMETEFRKNNFKQGLLEGITRITAELATHFPAAKGEKNENELSDSLLFL